MDILPRTLVLHFLLLLFGLCLLTQKSQAQDSTYNKRFVNRLGYSFSDIEAKDSLKRKANATSTDLHAHVGLQMKLSALWSSQAELSLRRQSFSKGVKPETSYLLRGQFDLRRKIFPRFDLAAVGGLKQENFLYGDGGKEIAVKTLNLPLIGIQAYADLFRFLTSGISFKVAYHQYFSGGKEDLNINRGAAVRGSLNYLLRYRQIDWSIELLHERAQYDGTYQQANNLTSINLGMAYE